MEALQELNVELFGRYKSFSTISAPAFWEYVEAYSYRSDCNGELLEINGTKFFSGSYPNFLTRLKTLLQAKKLDFGKVTDWTWAMARLIEPGTMLPQYEFVITPDGQMFVSEHSHYFLTAVKAPELKTKGRSDGVAYRYMTDRHDNGEDQYRRPEWEQTQQFLTLLDEQYFKPAFLKARQKFIKEAKESGEWDARIEKQKAKKLSANTNNTMKVCMQAKKAIEELEQYLKDINNGTVTQKQIGQLYYTMVDLSTLNKRIKHRFPKE